ncbi:MAG TPA: Asp23/Gls24 family envelope stress response protein [Gaiellaceae bacterium]|nr:Asp23/Gls24 family envelope stress response protein [Gaiellaceae bacterium]
MSDTHTITDDAGTITVTGGALSQVVLGAVQTVDGARARRPKRGLEIEVDDGSARVSLELAVRYGEVLPDVAEEVQQRVHDALRTMCGVETTAVDVAVEELDT